MMTVSINTMYYIFFYFYNSWLITFLFFVIIQIGGQANKLNSHKKMNQALFSLCFCEGKNGPNIKMIRPIWVIPTVLFLGLTVSCHVISPQKLRSFILYDHTNSFSCKSFNIFPSTFIPPKNLSFYLYQIT
jgi:hypothetical protein